MLFKRRFYPGLLDGSITVTYRLWSRPQAKTGRRYRLDETHALEVDAVGQVPAGGISDREARRSGFADSEALLAELSRGSGRSVTARTQVYRVAFHLVRAGDRRAALAKDAGLSERELQTVSDRLARMDATSKHGLWTHETLMLIDRRPRVAASELAKRVGRETQSFKADVRKLKDLGLTISHEVGYELSPRGRAYLKRLSQRVS